MSPNNNHTPAASQQPAGGAHPLDRYTTQPQSSGEQEDKSPYYHSAAPSVSLPKGGGALKGIDEKFSVNAVNGSAGLSVSLPLTPGRSGFTPSLALSYNSGSGNSEFGLGWGLGLPSIQRKTDKKLPLYNDADESDVFILAGAEDLIPLLVETTPGEWQPDERIEVTNIFEPHTDADGTVTFTSVSAHCLVKRYRPRIEGLFARIEYIRSLNGASWWRITTKENITTWYGLTAGARLASPDEPMHVFKWMPELVTDNKGNVQHYLYKQENFENVPTALHEHNRNNGQSPFCNLYLKRVRYSNVHPSFPNDTAPFSPSWPANAEDYLMELVLDYGEHSDQPTEDVYWSSRSDAFSGFHAGFEIRTYRRCLRALMFHRFAELNSGDPLLVRSLEFNWQHGSYNAGDPLTEADYITGITETGYKQLEDGSIISKSLPGMLLEFQPLQWNSEVRTVSPEDALNAPQGLTGPYQWIDLGGEGLPGILTEQGNGWYYKSNLGNGHFTPAMQVAEKPSFTGLAGGTLQWQDLDADGRRQVVSRQAGVEGFFELDDEQHWQSFRPFKKRANVDWNSPHTKMLDLNGDGKPDLLITNDLVWTWYENKGTKGFEEGGQSSTVFDEEKGPRLVLNDAVQSIFLADMNGDGLTDIVRIKNGEVCYWPNMGYGKFGAKVAMSNAPHFDTPDLFNPLYLQLTDISGTGAPDLIYLGQGTFKVWINLAGNAFSEPHEIATLPGMGPYSKVALLDFLGNGTGCIVWSSPLPQHAYAPMRYIDLMGGKKPYLMHTYHNGMGKKVKVEYKSSTQYYLADKAAGTPWATRLPFPVQCIEKITTTDSVSDTSFTQTYSYRHGYYDHEEREFRGFGRVDTLDIDTATLPNSQSQIPDSLNQPQVLTKTWYHTGAWMREQTLLDAYRAEYFHFEGWEDLATQATFEAQLSPRELREAHRALKGSPLRQEIYAKDGTAQQGIPYAITVSGYNVKRIQPSMMLWGGSGNASFLTYGSESLSYSYERSAAPVTGHPADLRLAHSLTLEIDEYGHVLKSAQVAYPRRSEYLPPVPASPLEDKLEPVRIAQQQMHITVATAAYTNDVGVVALVPVPPTAPVSGYHAAYRLRLPYRQRAYELYVPQSLQPAEGTLWKRDDFAQATILPAEAAAIDFSASFNTGIAGLRLLSHSYTLFAADDAPDTALNIDVNERLQSLAIPYEQYTLAFTPDILTGCYGSGTITPAILEAGSANEGGGYVNLNGDGNWWVPSGRAVYGTLPKDRFYQPAGYTDPWGNETFITWWKNDNNHSCYLLPETVTDALGNITSVTRYNWCHLQPEELMDANENISEVVFDALGMAVAMAVKGKDDGTEGDTLAGLDADTKSLQDAFWNDLENEAAAKAVLGGATWHCLYDTTSTPVRVAMIGRERHHADDPNSPVIVRFTYTDGFGRVAMHKAQAADDAQGNHRWLASGKTIYNNKGKAVMQYEPYFTAGAGYDPASTTTGVSPKLYYDPMGRLYKTVMPDGSYSMTTWDNWQQAVYDANDTVSTDWLHAPLSTAANGTADEADAATKAKLYFDTPSIMHLDTLGRPFFTVQQHRQVDAGIPGDDPRYYSYETLDILANRLYVTDANGLKQLTYKYNLLKAPCYQSSVDGGNGQMLMDAAGQPLWHTDAAGNIFTIIYDALRRPAAKLVTDTNGTRMAEQTIYADGPSADYLLNLRGKMTEHYDGSGKQYVNAYDFKGLPVASYQQLVADYTLAEPDWSAGYEPALDSGVFTTTAVVDALGRMVTGTDAGGYITRHTYDHGGQLTGVYMTRPGFAEDTYVQDIHYNAKGQRETIWYGNGSKVVYTYDDLTYRLRRQATRRMTATSVWEDVQDVYYYYDPAGNITRIRDEAADVVFRSNTIIEPVKDYTYDALYRLIRAEGRELTSSASFGTDDNYDDRVSMANGNDLRNYTQTYEYDGVGNILYLNHSASDNTGFTRIFRFTAGCNRLKGSDVVTSVATPYSYTYDARGNMTSMPHLSAMGWNTGSELSMVVAGVVNGFYQYSGGQRIRKVVEKTGFTEERIYLGSYERYRKYVSGSVDVERDTVHIADDTGRIAMLEERVQGWDASEQVLKRFIYSNHLQNSALELDESGEIISYEEYHPYGTTAYQAMSATIKATAKRYRFTGKERDEESGLNYHGARYYAPWLCRWTAVDPLESKYAGWSAYQYCTCNPIMETDSTGMGNDDHIETHTVAQKYEPGIAVNGFTMSIPKGYQVMTYSAGENSASQVIALKSPQGSIYKWDEKAAWYTNGKGGEFDNPWFDDITNWVQNSTQHGIGQLAKDALENGDPFSSIETAYAQHMVETGGMGTPGTFIGTGLVNSLARTYNDVSAGGQKRTQALIGIWQFGSNTAKNVGAFAGNGGSKYFFRGTTEGYEGGRGTLISGVTPTSKSPLVATAYAIEAKNKGESVIQIFTRESVRDIKKAGQNVAGFAKFEQEMGMVISPTELAKRAVGTISLKQATTILESMGIKMPANVTLSNLNEKLMSLPIMSNAQIRTFTLEALKHVK